jgi:hypothetical protein
VEHLADELHTRRFVRIRLFKVHHQPKCTVFERSICGTNDYSIPANVVSGSLRLAVIACGTSYQVMTLSAMGDAETPAGGSVCIRYRNTELAEVIAIKSSIVNLFGTAE